MRYLYIYKQMPTIRLPTEQERLDRLIADPDWQCPQDDGRKRWLFAFGCECKRRNSSFDKAINAAHLLLTRPEDPLGEIDRTVSRAYGIASTENSTSKGVSHDIQFNESNLSCGPTRLRLPSANWLGSVRSDAWGSMWFS
jgi:hypothetical protein